MNDENTAYAKGRSYEEFVAQVYQAILLAEKLDGKIQSVKLERNKKILCKSGALAEVDIYWEYQIADVDFKVAIECKNFKTSVSVGRVREFADKIDDIGGIRGLFVTKTGFQDGAEKVGIHRNIKLINMRKPQDSDWDGYLREININFVILSDPRVISIQPKINKEWAIGQGMIEGEAIRETLLEDKIIFEDRSDGFKKTVHELRTQEFGKAREGKHEWVRDFKDGWFHLGDKEMKLDAAKIVYEVPQPFSSGMNIDLTQYALAVMEYVDGNSGKFVVTVDGEKKPY